MKSTSDILLKIVDCIKQSGISATCQSLFGKGMSFIVGGYAQKLANDEDAPFCLVMNENSDSAVNSDKVISFGAKIILGICPMRDVPSTNNVDGDIVSASSFITKILNMESQFKNLLTDETDIAFAEDVIERCDSFKDEFNAAVSGAKDAKESGDYSLAITKYETALSKTGAFCSCTRELFDHTWVDVQGTQAQDVLDSMYDVWEDYTLITTSKGYSEFQRDTANLRQDFNAYIDDPFIKHVSSDGTIIYGAQQIMDDLREKTVSALSSLQVGLAVDSISVNCSSVSHYPLEWCEITLSMSCPDALSDAALND